MNKQVKILCVCGSGTVSSSMVAEKLKEKLGERGFAVSTVEAMPSTVDSELAAGGFSLVACVSPVYQELSIPKVNAVALLTGLGESDVIDECVRILGS
ncbi:MAG: PTS fructose transporter subunit IIB [Oscillospiraceae bacterium]|nr:PTS fructose transporter subunit IIB [Oscillospiraceae bacterium]